MIIVSINSLAVNYAIFKLTQKPDFRSKIRYYPRISGNLRGRIAKIFTPQNNLEMNPPENQKTYFFSSFLILKTSVRNFRKFLVEISQRVRESANRSRMANWFGTAKKRHVGQNCPRMYATVKTSNY